MVRETRGAMGRQTKAALVTGGRGFVGRAVGKLLQREGYAVVSLDHAPLNEDFVGDHSARVARTQPSTESAGTSEVQCDITDAAALRAVFEGHSIAAIVHLAAILPTIAQREPVRATQVNVNGSLNLLECARRFGVRRFLFGGSVSIYGSRPMDQVVSEHDGAAPEDLYGAAKLYVEQLGQSYRDVHGLEFVSLRIARVVGPGANSTTSAWRSEIFEKLNTNEAAEISIPYADSERVLLTHVNDIAQMLLTLLRAGRPGHAVYNAPCESLLVEELKAEIERLDSKVHVKLGGSSVRGNPYRLDASRFEREFGFKAITIAEHLRLGARSQS